MSVATVIELQFEAKSDGWDAPPGPELGALLASVNLAELPDDELLKVMAAWRRQATWASAGELAAVAELADRRDAEQSKARDQVKAGEFVAEEISLALTVTGQAAGTLLSLAVALTGRLPVTWQRLKDGRIDVPRARVIADALLGVSHEVSAVVEQHLFPEAERLTTGRLRHLLRQAILEVDPDAAEERRKRAVKGRRLELTDTPSGTCDLSGRDLPVEEADAAFNRINAAALAMQADGDERSIDAIRADLFSALLRGIALPDAMKPSEERPTPPLTSGGRFDAKPHADSKHRVANPEAISALTGEVAALIADVTNAHLTSAAKGRGRGRAFAANAAAQSLAQALADLKHRWCTAINGQVPNTSGGHGHDGYRPPAAMRRLIQADYGRCAFPTCRRNAARCDLDHTQAWEKFGATCWCNLAPLCRRHHRLKQEPEWTLLQLWPGVLLWITPSGQWHIITPADRE